MFVVAPVVYCKLGNFCEIFIFANSVKRHICDVRNSQLRQVLPTPVSYRVILPFRKGYIFMNFTYAKFCENKTLMKISEFTVYLFFVGLVICFAVLCVLSGFAIISLRKRELVALLSLCSECHVTIIVL